MTVAIIPITPGSGLNLASYAFTDSDSTVKHLQRIVLADALGAEMVLEGVGMLSTLATVLSRLNDSIDTNWYGTPTVSVVTVATTSGVLLTANANRKANPTFANNGATTIWIRGDGGTASATAGIPVLAGGVYTPPTQNYVNVGSYTAIAATSSCSVTVSEPQ